MKTNQKFHALRILSLVCMLFFTFSLNGQNVISDIKQGGETKTELFIKITPPKGQPSNVKIRKNSTISSGSILEVPSNTVVFITSSNGNIGQIIGPNTVEFTASAKGEEYRVLDGSGTSNVLVKVFKQLTGGVLTSGPTGEIHARSRLTEFLIAYDGNETNFELLEGKIDVNRRQRVEIKDESKIDSTKTRALFITATSQLTPKDPKLSFNSDNAESISLNTENEINKFLDKQLGNQKRTFTKAGAKAKKATKLLENGVTDKGIEQMEQAYEDGEIRLDFIVQSALMLSDSYFRNEDLEKSRSWLDAGLHFSKLLYDMNKEKFDHFSKIGKNKVAKAFGYDLIIANEYNTWGFTLKSRINGCLENENENPSKFRRNANLLRKEISNY